MKFLKYIFPILLTAIAVYICFKNYSPGTYLLGWDSMHPEFNFPLNVSRMVSHVWAGEQGVGAISAHSDMSDLPRILILWISSFVLPVSFLRYFYIFLCLILGPLGIYFFLKYVFEREKETVWIYPAAFLGGMFYLLNLGTLQNFYVPLEMFTTAFAFAPWMFLTGLKYVREGGRKNVLLFIAAVIFASPMAYAATQAYSIYAGLLLFLLTFTFISSAGKLKLKRLGNIVFLSLALNLFWILPNIYSLVQQSQTISNANINRLFSPEAFLRNVDYGDFRSVLLQKSFLFSWRNFSFVDNQFRDLLLAWNNHLVGVYVTTVGYILSGLGLTGLIGGVIKRNKVILATIPTLLLVLFFLFNINPPVGNLYSYLYNNFGVFSEGFRMPFTKFSVLFEILMSLYFGYFAYVVLTNSKIVGIIKLLFFAVLVSGISYFALPAFGGELIGKNVRVSLPSSYLNLFKWFDNAQNGRIALLPIDSKYGWEYRNWGYEGSGFLTYGIKQPILYRDFDRWNSANEDFYSESVFAINEGNSVNFLSVLKKYNVKYILLDESIILAGEKDPTRNITQTKKLLTETGLTEIAKFDFLSVYETGNKVSDISVPESFVKTNYDSSYSSVDNVYPKYGNYVNENPKISGRTYPKIKAQKPLISEDFSINRGFPDAVNCDLNKIGIVSKENSKDGILYKADGGGVSCDYLDYSNLAYKNGMVLRISGENKSGRSLKIYLFNTKTKFAELEELLPEGKFDETFLIYPKNIEGSGYLLSLETRSFGRIASENLLSKVEFYSATPEKPEVEDSIQNNLKIQNTKKYGNFGYSVDVQDRGLIQLDTGYEEGWVALNSSGLLKHVEINGWANGWIVDSSQNRIYIFFWPQILEWIGIISYPIILTFSFKRDTI